MSLLASEEELVLIPSLADALEILNPQQTTHLLVLALSPSLSSLIICQRARGFFTLKNGREVSRSRGAYGAEL